MWRRPSRQQHSSRGCVDRETMGQCHFCCGTACGILRVTCAHSRYCLCTTNTPTHSNTHSHTHACTHTLSPMHTCAHTLSHTHTCIHTHAHTHTHTLTHTHACMHTRTHTHTHARTRTRTHAHTHTYTHTHTHTHTFPSPPPSSGRSSSAGLDERDAVYVVPDGASSGLPSTGTARRCSAEAARDPPGLAACHTPSGSPATPPFPGYEFLDGTLLLLFTSLFTSLSLSLSLSHSAAFY